MSGLRAYSLDQQVAIRTPEHVAFAFDVAGIGSRALAYFIDWLIRFVAAALLIFAMQRVVELRDILPKAWVRFETLILMLIYFGTMWVYMPLFEVLWEGQTPGKRLTKIRVVKDDGTSITILDALLRNVLRIVDFLPTLYGAALITMFLNRESKRIGDYVAGTMVVKERQFALDQYLERDAETGWIRETAESARDAPKLPPLLSPAEFELVTQFLDRRQDFDMQTRAGLAEQLAARFRERADLRAVSDAQPEAEAFLAALAARGTSRSTARPDARTPRGARLTAPHALDRFVALRRARWEKLGTLLSEIGERGLPGLGHRRLAELGRLYRQVSADHALSQTYYPGAAVAAYLNRLVAAAHNKIYRRTGVTWRTLLDFYLVEVPAAFQVYRRYFLLSLAAFGAPALAAFALVLLDPRFSDFVVSPGLMDHIERREMWTQDLWLHTPGDSGLDRMAETTSVAVYLLTNNIMVTVMVFVSGILLGAGTLYYLTLNGFLFGAITALVWQHGMSGDFWAFVTPHGVIEISMILVGGMGGFMLGNCILAPGRYTRRDAFKVHGRAAARLMLACVPVLIMAGWIESSFSPMPAPLALKVVFGLTLGAVLYTYLFSRSPRRDRVWDATFGGIRAVPVPSPPDSD